MQKRRVTVTLIFPDEQNLDWLQSQLTLEGWLATGILPLLEKASLSDPQEEA